SAAPAPPPPALRVFPPARCSPARSPRTYAHSHVPPNTRTTTAPAPAAHESRRKSTCAPRVQAKPTRPAPTPPPQKAHIPEAARPKRTSNNARSPSSPHLPQAAKAPPPARMTPRTPVPTPAPAATPPRSGMLHPSVKRTSALTCCLRRLPTSLFVFIPI